jgi:uncharacterized protein YtpQ (UPF0354 family)
MKMKNTLSLLALAAILTAGLSACVTINIYFPAAAAEKAADKIIDEVWQLKDGVSAPAGKATEKTTEKNAEKVIETPAK